MKMMKIGRVTLKKQNTLIESGDMIRSPERQVEKRRKRMICSALS